LLSFGQSAYLSTGLDIGLKMGTGSSL